ncbi:hypothetical protein BJ170DRAFT_712947 [Xylariales sp. AK1849]|nr:hypothetical protein BJ170DRAFT_712947 [Xylariales sp. AK1849]
MASASRQAVNAALSTLAAHNAPANPALPNPGRLMTFGQYATVLDYLRSRPNLPPLLILALHCQEEVEKRIPLSILYAKPVRELKFVPPGETDARTGEDLNTDKWICNIMALALFVSGKQVTACGFGGKHDCAKVFPFCVIADHEDPEIAATLKEMTLGACANCYIDNNRTRCPFAKEYARLKKEQNRGGDDDDDDEEEEEEEEVEVEENPISDIHRTEGAGTRRSARVASLAR